ncbi:MAG TPA: hypothetical protein VN018_07735 [Brevundimonas sp.]|nr:hypothetical protein [Brevundimonas sp.]
MSHDPNACYCGGGEAGHVVGCPAPPCFDLRDAKLTLPISSHVRLIAAARMVFDIRPTNWADDEDPDQVAAWSALEEALRASGGLS